METKPKIDQFLDADGRIKQLPSKMKARLAVLEYLADKFERGRDYTEKQVNAICEEWHTFGDFTLLRRELIDFSLMNREPNGSRYWRPEEENA